MAFTEEQQQRMATQKRDAARRRAASALRDSSKQSSLPASAITEQQRQRCEENKRRALQLRNVRASQLAVSSKVTTISYSAPIGQASALTDDQKRRMEHNRRLALERKTKGAKNGVVTHPPSTMRSAQHVVSSTTTRPITGLQRKRMEDNCLAALEKKNKRANNGFVTPPPTSRSQSSVPTACKRPKIAADPLFSNGSILMINGVHFRQTDVAIGDAVHLVREPHNVSFYLCFFNLNVATNKFLSIVVFAGKRQKRSKSGELQERTRWSDCLFTSTTNFTSHGHGKQAIV